MESVLKGNIKKIENSQERHSIPCVFSRLNYEERLRRMKFTTLNDRRTIEGIKMYKVMNEQKQIECLNFPKLKSNLEITGPAMGVRGKRRRIRRESFKSEFRNNFAHSLTVTVKISNRVTMSYSVTVLQCYNVTMFYSDTVNHNFFLNRTALIWNELPEIVVSSS